MKKKRPFSFLSRPLHSYYYYLAIFACLLTSVVLLLVYRHEIALEDEHAASQKLQLMINDLEDNFALHSEIALKLSTSVKFHPETLSHNKYQDLELLEEFTHYHNLSPLSEEMFLFYSEKDYIFQSTGYTTSLSVYLDTFAANERKILSNVLGASQTTDQYLLLSDKLIIIKPLKLYSAQSAHHALLGFVIPQDTLIDRFKLVSGGLDGDLALYCRDALLLSSASDTKHPSNTDLYSKSTSDQAFRITYQPTHSQFPYASNVLIYILLLFSLWGIVMTIASLFAKRTKSSLMSISGKYRGHVTTTDTSEPDDILTDIQAMIEHLIASNADIQTQVLAKQSILRDQIIYNLLHGDISYDAQTLLSEHFDFPGPCYYAGCIAFAPSSETTEEQRNHLAMALMDLTNKDTDEYIYAIYESSSALVNFICSSTEEQTSSLSDCIYEIASGFGEDITVSVGPICGDLSGIHNSWLQSNDLLYADISLDSIDFANITYDTNIQHMLSSVTEGNSDATIQAFNLYFDSVDEANKSALLMQKIYIQFANELVTLSNNHRIELNYQEIHSVITAKEHSQFVQHAHSLLRHICEQRKLQIGTTKSSVSQTIVSYIREHYTDYDISIEKVALDTNTTPALVRSVVHQESGFLYRDYIVHLRLEYAKKLLLSTKLSVADICAKVGYANTSYFVRIFRENTGVTPSKFRQINGGS